MPSVRQCRTLCLVSATQTGSLAGHLETILRQIFVFDLEHETLFRLGQSPIETLHDLSRDSRFSYAEEPGNSLLFCVSSTNKD